MCMRPANTLAALQRLTVFQQTNNHLVNALRIHTMVIALTLCVCLLTSFQVYANEYTSIIFASFSRFLICRIVYT